MRSHFMVASSLAAACATAAPECRGQLAWDTPGHAAYDNGWQVGDNGGFGFGPWNMTGTYNTPIQHVLDAVSSPNNVKVAPANGGAPRAWALYNPDAPEPTGSGTGTDVSTAGRRLLTPLQVGQKLTVIIDNPTERRFFRGYTVRLNTGGGNTVYAGTPQSRLAVGTFEYFTNGKWFATGTGGNPTLFDTDTDAGMRIEVTLNTVNTFTLKMTPLDNPGLAFTKSGTLEGPQNAPIDWIEFEIYNTDSDWYPTQSAPNAFTDFYIGGMSVGCYPDCNGSGTLTVADFGCFQTKFVAQDPYADCNGSGTRTVADFGCFQTKFVAGCP